MILRKLRALSVFLSVLTIAACTLDNHDEDSVVHSSSAANNCSDLRRLQLPHTVITQAEPIPAGNFIAADGIHYTVPAFCKVHGVAIPTANSHINFEVWLPKNTWNGRFYQLGTGGFSGALERLSGKLVESIARGNAVAMTDGGHKAHAKTADGFKKINKLWALHSPEKIIDFGYRALKQTTDSAQSIIGEFYQQRPRYNYYAGCSGGGREALVAAARYPDDWDGILVGAPATDIVRAWTSFAWVDGVLFADSSTQIPASKLPAIQAMALASCTADAYLIEGIAADPRFCRLNTAALICKGPENDSCLTKPQAVALEKVYEGVRNPRTGMLLYPGFESTMEAEGEWESRFMGELKSSGERALEQSVNNFFRTMVFDDMTWNSQSFDFDRDIGRALNKDIAGERLKDVLGPPSLDFSGLKNQGAKIIAYHGWGDAVLPAKNGIADYERTVDKLGGLRKTQDFYRLFMVPGMLHCAGGPGANAFGQLHIVNHLPALRKDSHHDISLALEKWVEKGIAPDRIIAAKYVDDNTEKGVAFTRPLCSYPQLPVYKGEGNVNEANSFECRAGVGHHENGKSIYSSGVMR